MISRTLDGRHIDKLSLTELRAELRGMTEYAARLEPAAKCFHEDLRTAPYRGSHEPEVMLYTCRKCNFSWKE